MPRKEVIKLNKPTCICREEMTFLMDNKKSEIWQCQSCHRILLRSKVSIAQVWYVPEARLEGDWQLRSERR